MGEELKFSVWCYEKQFIWWKPWTWWKRKILYQGNDFEEAKKATRDNWPNKTAEEVTK